MKVTTKQARTSTVLTVSMGLLLLALAALGLSKPSHAAGFENIDPPQNTSVTDKVEVLEYLWLGCPHCYSLEPSMEEWMKTKPEWITFVREAPPLNDSWTNHSRGFYAAQLMGKEQEFVVAMFEAIHKKKKPMRDPKKIAALAATIGLDEAKFLKAMNSFAVNGKRSRDMAIKSGISSVPSIIINGKYRTSSSIAGGHEGIIDTINERAEFEKAAMKLP